MYGRDGYHLDVATADGKTVLQTTAPSAPLPHVAPVPATRAPALDDIHDWSPGAEHGRLLSAFGHIGGATGQTVRVTVSRERPSRSEILRNYAGNLLVAISISAVLVALLGFVIVRHGMRPLRQVISKANDISTHRLNTRLSVHDTPLELEELGTAFNAMLDRLEDGVQRLARFAADLAHDMRTPISTLMVETQVVLSHPRSVDEYQALAASNIEEYERLSRMIENTLFLARVDNAQQAMTFETLDAHHELQRIAAYFDGLADEAGITLAVPDGPGPGPALRADPILLRRAVSNVVSNALRHTPRGGRIELWARADADGPRIDISNTGAGIGADHLPHIFDRYYRADPARASSSSAGLGLSIVRAIMALHGGDVSVASTPGQRTTFSLRFGA